MKNRVYSLLSIAVAALLLLSACGGSAASASTAARDNYSYFSTESSSGGKYDMEYSSDYEIGETPTAISSTDIMQQERKVIKHVNLDMETKDFDQTLDAILSQITAAGGYIQNQNVNGSSMYYKGSYYERYAYIEARVPVEALDGTAESISELGNVTSRNSSIDDITDTYYDTQTRLETLTIQEERLLELLARADNLDDLIKLESALTEVRYEIESLTASINRMDKQVSYSYLNISLNEVSEYRLLQNQPRTFGDRLRSAFGNSLDNIADTLEGLLFFVIEDLPVLLIYLVIILLIVCIVRSILRAYRKRTGKTQGKPLFRRRRKKQAAWEFEKTMTQQPAQAGETMTIPKPVQPVELQSEDKPE